MDTECDIRKIKNEDLLTKMWQQSNDTKRREEIHSQLIQLRDSRLRDLYQEGRVVDIMSQQPGSGFGKDPLTPSHGDSLVDQSFQSLKSKEVRDSMSPTYDMKFHSLALNQPNSSGWDVQTSSEVSPDGRAYRTDTLAKTDGVEKINGGIAAFKGLNEQHSSASHEGDDQNYVKRAAESSKTHLQENVVIGDANSGRTEIKKSSKTSSSSKVISSSSTVYHDENPHESHYLTDGRTGTTERQHVQNRMGSTIERQHVQNHYDKQHEQQQLREEQYSKQQQQQQQQHNHQQETRETHHTDQAVRQYKSTEQQYNQNRQETTTSSTKAEMDKLYEENKHYIDMDKTSPEYQQRVRYLMAQPGEIISNTVEYPKPNVKMITTVKRLPDGTIVKNKRYETEELQPTTESTRTRTTSSQLNQTNVQKKTERHLQDQENVFTRLANTRDQPSSRHPASPTRQPRVDSVDNVKRGQPPSGRPSQPSNVHPDSQSYDLVETEDVSNIAKFSSVQKSSRRFSTETTSETIEEVEDSHPTYQTPGQRNKNIPGRHQPQDFQTHGFPSVRPNKLTQEYPTDKPKAPGDFQTHGFPSVRPNKATQEYPIDRPQAPGDNYRKPTTVQPKSPDAHQPISKRPTGYSPNADTEVVIVSETKNSSTQKTHNTERIVETEVVHDNKRYPSVDRERPSELRIEPDFQTHGFPSVKQSSPHREASPRTFHPSSPRRSQPTEDFSTNGFPSVKTPTSPYNRESPVRGHSTPRELPITVERQAPSSTSPSQAKPKTPTPATNVSTTKKTNNETTTYTTVRREKEVDAAHRAFAASLRCSSPIDNVRRDSYSDHQRYTSRSSVGSRTSSRRDHREGSHDSTAPSETSRISSGTVTRQSPSKTAGRTSPTKHPATKPHETPQRIAKSPSPTKSVTTTTTTTVKKTTVDVPKSDNQKNKPAVSKFPINEPPLTITKTQLSTNDATSFPRNKVVEEPICIKKHFYQLGPSDKTPSSKPLEYSPASPASSSSRPRTHPQTKSPVRKDQYTENIDDVNDDIISLSEIEICLQESKYPEDRKYPRKPAEMDDVDRKDVPSRYPSDRKYPNKSVDDDVPRGQPKKPSIGNVTRSQSPTKSTDDTKQPRKPIDNKHVTKDVPSKHYDNQKYTRKPSQDEMIRRQSPSKYPEGNKQPQKPSDDDCGPKDERPLKRFPDDKKQQRKPNDVEIIEKKSPSMNHGDGKQPRIPNDNDKEIETYTDDRKTVRKTTKDHIIEKEIVSKYTDDKKKPRHPAYDDDNMTRVKPSKYPDNKQKPRKPNEVETIEKEILITSTDDEQYVRKTTEDYVIDEEITSTYPVNRKQPRQPVVDDYITKGQPLKYPGEKEQPRKPAEDEDFDDECPSKYPANKKNPIKPNDKDDEIESYTDRRNVLKTTEDYIVEKEIVSKYPNNKKQPRQPVDHEHVTKERIPKYPKDEKQPRKPADDEYFDGERPSKYPGDRKYPRKPTDDEDFDYESPSKYPGDRKHPRKPTDHEDFDGKSPSKYPGDRKHPRTPTKDEDFYGESPSEYPGDNKNPKKLNNDEDFDRESPSEYPGDKKYPRKPNDDVKEIITYTDDDKKVFRKSTEDYIVEKEIVSKHTDNKKQPRHPVDDDYMTKGRTPKYPEDEKQPRKPNDDKDFDGESPSKYPGDTKHPKKPTNDEDFDRESPSEYPGDKKYPRKPNDDVKEIITYTDDDKKVFRKTTEDYIVEKEFVSKYPNNKKQPRYPVDDEYVTKERIPKHPKDEKKPRKPIDDESPSKYPGDRKHPRKPTNDEDFDGESPSEYPGDNKNPKKPNDDVKEIITYTDDDKKVFRKTTEDYIVEKEIVSKYPNNKKQPRYPVDDEYVTKERIPKHPKDEKKPRKPIDDESPSKYPGEGKHPRKPTNDEDFDGESPSEYPGDNKNPKKPNDDVKEIITYTDDDKKVFRKTTEDYIVEKEIVSKYPNNKKQPRYPVDDDEYVTKERIPKHPKDEKKPRKPIDDESPSKYPGDKKHPRKPTDDEDFDDESPSKYPGDRKYPRQPIDDEDFNGGNQSKSPSNRQHPSKPEDVDDCEKVTLTTVTDNSKITRKVFEDDVIEVETTTISPTNRKQPRQPVDDTHVTKVSSSEYPDEIKPIPQTMYPGDKKKQVGPTEEPLQKYPDDKSRPQKHIIEKIIREKTFEKSSDNESEEELLKTNISTIEIDTTENILKQTNRQVQNTTNIKTIANEFITKESQRPKPIDDSELPDGSLPSKPGDINEPTSPTYRKKGVSRSETFEERCRQILGMEDAGDTQGKYVKKDDRDMERPKDIPSNTVIETQTDKFVVRVEDCEDDEPQYTRKPSTEKFRETYDTLPKEKPNQQPLNKKPSKPDETDEDYSPTTQQEPYSIKTTEPLEPTENIPGYTTATTVVKDIYHQKSPHYYEPQRITPENDDETYINRFDKEYKITEEQRLKEQVNQEIQSTYLVRKSSPVRKDSPERSPTRKPKKPLEYTEPTDSKRHPTVGITEKVTEYIEGINAKTTKESQKVAPTKDKKPKKPKNKDVKISPEDDESSSDTDVDDIVEEETVEISERRTSKEIIEHDKRKTTHSVLDTITTTETCSPEYPLSSVDKITTDIKYTKFAPGKTPEPLRKYSPEGRSSPERKISPERKLSPERKYSPERQYSPEDKLLGKYEPERPSPGREYPMQQKKSPERKTPKDKYSPDDLYSLTYSTNEYVRSEHLQKDTNTTECTPTSDRKPSPDRKYSPERKLSPVRKQPSERKQSPERKPSLDSKNPTERKVSPERIYAPGRRDYPEDIQAPERYQTPENKHVPKENVPEDKHFPERKPSPQRSYQPGHRQSPVRKSSPDRKYSPNRMPSPEPRDYTEDRKPVHGIQSPDDKHTPQERKLSPERRYQPGDRPTTVRQSSPERKLSSERKTYPERKHSPQRQYPERDYSPEREQPQHEIPSDNEYVSEDDSSPEFKQSPRRVHTTEEPNKPLVKDTKKLKSPSKVEHSPERTSKTFVSRVTTTVGSTVKENRSELSPKKVPSSPSQPNRNLSTKRPSKGNVTEQKPVNRTDLRSKQRETVEKSHTATANKNFTSKKTSTIHTSTVKTPETRKTGREPRKETLPGQRAISPHSSDEEDTQSSPDVSPARSTEHRRSSNISVHTEIVIDHTGPKSPKSPRKQPSRPMETDEELLRKTLTQKQTKKLSVTERKESAPVHRVTRKNKEPVMSRSISEKIIKNTIPTKKPQPSSLAPTTTKSEKRPNKCLTTKSINLSALDTITTTDSKVVDNIIIDIQHAKSSREPSPDKIVPTPVYSNVDTGKPRYPDVVQEPEDEPRRKPVVKNIPIFEEDSNEYIGCQIEEVNVNKTTENIDNTEVVHEILGSPTVEAPVSLGYDSLEPTEDVCLLSVHDKVSKFTLTAEETKKPKPSAKPIREIDHSQNVPEDDECLLTVDQKVNKFLKTAEKITNEVYTTTAKEINCPTYDNDEISPVDNYTHPAPSSPEKLAPSLPQSSPQLVAQIERKITQQLDTDIPEKRGFKPSSRSSPSPTRQGIRRIPEREPSSPMEDDKSDDLVPMTKTHTTSIELRRQKDILSRASIFTDDKRSLKDQKSQPSKKSPQKPTADREPVVKPLRKDISPDRTKPSSVRRTVTQQRYTDDSETDVQQNVLTTKTTHVNKSFINKTKVSDVKRKFEPETKKPHSPKISKDTPDTEEDMEPEYVNGYEIRSTTRKPQLPQDAKNAPDNIIESPYANQSHHRSPSRSPTQSPTRSPTRLPYDTPKRTSSKTTEEHVIRSIRKETIERSEDEFEVINDRRSPVRKTHSPEYPEQPKLSAQSPKQSPNYHPKTTSSRITERTVEHIPKSSKPRYDVNEKTLDSPAQKKPSRVSPLYNSSPDSVAARRNLFEKGITTKTTKPSSPTKTSTTTQPGRRPSYMDHTKSSLEHTRRDSIEINKTNYSRRTSIDEEHHYEQKPNSAVQFDTKVIDNKTDLENVNIEEIFDLVILEQMLETFTSYDFRRRIRAQIRLVKKNAQNIAVHSEKSTYSLNDLKSTTTATRQPKGVEDYPKSRSPSRTPTSSRRSPSLTVESEEPIISSSVNYQKTQTKDYSTEQEQTDSEYVEEVRRRTSQDRIHNETTITSKRTHSPSALPQSAYITDKSTPSRPTAQKYPDIEYVQGVPRETSTRGVSRVVTTTTSRRDYSPTSKPQSSVTTTTTRRIHSPSSKPQHSAPQDKKTSDWPTSQEQTDSEYVEEIPRRTSTQGTTRVVTTTTTRRTHSPSSKPQGTVTTTTTRRVHSPSSKPENSAPQSRVVTTTTTRRGGPRDQEYPSRMTQQEPIDDDYEEETPGRTSTQGTTRVITTKTTRSTHSPSTKPISTSPNEPQAPIWTDRKNVLKNPSKTPIQKTSSTTRSNVTKSTTTTSNRRNQIEDSVTSSYGIGPTDENGLPLFGIKALKKKPQSQPCETTKEVTGYVVEEKYYSDNKTKPIVERKEVIYSSNADELEEIQRKLESESDLIEGTKKIERKYVTGAPDQDYTASYPDLHDSVSSITKYVRRGSVKEMSEKFIRKESQTGMEKTSTYPKAGLIYRTNSRSGTTDDSDCMETSGRKVETIRYNISGTDDDVEDVENGGGYTRYSHSSHIVHDGDSDSESMNVHREVRTQKSTRSFLNSSNESKIVTGVDDVLERMRNADNVVEDGDTAEDQEARALLNKFLGASVIMSGVETILPTKQTKIYANQYEDNDKFNQQVETTRVTTKSIKSGSSSSPVARKTFDIEEIWDEEFLRNLLEQAKSYEERSKIRARLRQLMAERKVCNNVVEDVSTELSSASLEGEKNADADSSASEYEEIIEEVTDYSDDDEEVVVSVKVNKTSEGEALRTDSKKEAKEEATTAKVTAEKEQENSLVEIAAKSAQKDDSEEAPLATKSQSSPPLCENKSVEKGESLMPLLEDLLHKNMPQIKENDMKTGTQYIKQPYEMTNATNTTRTSGLGESKTVSKVSSSNINYNRMEINRQTSKEVQGKQPTDDIARLNVPQREDSGTESGEDLRLIAAGIRDKLHMQSDTNLIEEVTTALNRLESSLKEGKDISLDERKRNALLALVERLQTGLVAPEKLSDQSLLSSGALDNRTTEDNISGNFKDTSSPEADEPRSNRQRFAKRRNRNNRHTVGVSREELEDARRYMEDMLLMENISNCTTPESSTAQQQQPPTFPIVKNASSGAILLAQPSSNLYRPNQFVSSGLRNATAYQGGEEKVPALRNAPKRPLSGEYTVSFGQNSNPLNEDSDRMVQTDRETNDRSPESSKSNRFSNKKQLLKRANTIDIPKNKNYTMEYDGESDAENKNAAQGLKRAIQVDVKKKVRNVVPPFEPKTENDRKFLAFINKQSDKPGLGWNNSKSVANWTNKFGSIKNTFEVGAAATATTGKPPQPPGHSTQFSAKNLWQKQTQQAQNYEEDFAAKARMQRSQQEVAERRRKHEVERLERERQEREHFETERLKRERLKREYMQKEQLERDYNERERLKREHFERDRQQREQLERELYEREHIEQLKREEQAKQRAINEQLEREYQERLERERIQSISQPKPVNQFIHAPQSVFRPIDSSEIHEPNIIKPIAYKTPNKAPHTWQSPKPDSRTINSESPQYLAQKFKSSASVSSCSTSPIGLPWLSKQPNSAALKQRANMFEEKTHEDKPVYRQNSLRSNNGNKQLMEQLRKRPSLPNTADPYSMQRNYQPETTFYTNPVYPPPPTNTSFTYADYTPATSLNYQSYPCLPTAVNNEQFPRTRQDSLTNPQAEPLVLSNRNPLYSSQNLAPNPYQRQFDYVSPLDSAPTSPSFMSMPQTDYTDDDLDSDSNIMEYRVQSKVMRKPQAQKAVTVGRRTNHMSDDEVYEHTTTTEKSEGKNGAVVTTITKVTTPKREQTTTTEKSEVKDGAVVTTTTKVTTRTVSQDSLKPVNAFAKFKQLDQQNTQQNPKSPTTATAPGGSSSAPACPTGTAPVYKFTNPALNARAATVKEQLLQWCQIKTKEYENVQITNFSTSWSDGLAFCALIHHFLPDAFDYSALTPENRKYNFELAFTVADEKAGIAPLLDVEDMVAMKRPDWKSVFVYVQSIYRRFRNCQ